MNLGRWLRPGMGVKRWLAVAFLGLTGLALAGALALRQIYRDVEVEGPAQAVIFLVTLQFLPYWVRAVVLLCLGLFLFGYGSYRVVRALLGPFTESVEEPLVDLVYRRRLLARGPRVVAIGGGTGLSVLLRGLKVHTANLTAIVSVADDGGSTGRLREQLGIPAVGDIRNCLVAMAETEPAMGELLQYRFGTDEGSLSGHAVGNLLITAMNAIGGGDFEAAVRQMNRVLAVRGSVVPASGTALTLHARLRDGSEVTGQSRVMRMSGIERVWLEPGDVRANRDALHAIAEADLVVLGPGSLYTSLLATILVPELRAALSATPALRVYVANVATQSGETEGYDLSDHVEALAAHGVADIFDVVLANSNLAAGPDAELGVPVKLRWPPAGASRRPRLVLDDVVDAANSHHHDPELVAAALLRLFGREAASRRGGIARTA
ncbi:MAG TPA: gluconeogenesis factor YvcK family protein [Patescibacteria group bacterium]|nr:gluconeogenesis factor YvcK family protein [Patescibacteria group bacterium]